MDACKVLLSCCLKVHWHIRRHLPIAPIIRRAALRQYKSSLKNPADVDVPLFRLALSKMLIASHCFCLAMKESQENKD